MGYSVTSKSSRQDIQGFPECSGKTAYRNFFRASSNNKSNQSALNQVDKGLEADVSTNKEGESIITTNVDHALEAHHKNYLDHVYAVSDDTGNLDEHYRYNAFGEVTIYNNTGRQTRNNCSRINNQILWNTRRRDKISGFYMYKMRHYIAPPRPLGLT